MRRWAILVALCVLAGCGGGDDDDTPQAKGLAGDPIPLADYIKRADKLCKAGRVKARKALTELQTSLQGDGELSDDDVMVLNAEGAEQVRPLVRKIQQLPPPDSKRKEADAYTRAMQETLFALDDAVKAYRDRDRVRTENALERNRDLAQDIISNARAVGFKECGTEFSS